MTSASTTRRSVGALSKLGLGVILPLVLFIGATALVFQAESSKGPDYGIKALTLWVVYIPGIPIILLVNSLLMIPAWRNVKEVCLVATILPTLLVLAECCVLAFLP